MASDALLKRMSTCTRFVSYPWDCLLLEIGFILVVSSPAMPNLALSGTVDAALPPPRLGVWLVRVLLARVLLGMGEKKFGPNWCASRAPQHEV
eukprot:SAG11_NODE_1740_length_4338_cov_2.608634_6_plen_93_part_00